MPAPEKKRLTYRIQPKLAVLPDSVCIIIGDTLRVTPAEQINSREYILSNR